MEKVNYTLRDYEHQRILMRSSTEFIQTSLSFIQTSVRSGKLSSQKAKSYTKEILHSIFFLGHINFPSIHPSDVLGEKIAVAFRQKYPDVFEGYQTKLPLRPPYSILLDVVIETTGDDDVCGVQSQLLDLNEKMHVPNNDGGICGNDFCLAATAVSYCYFLDKETKQETKKYFGVSVACKGWRQRQIFIDLSCIKTWSRNVALAVCLAAETIGQVLLPDFVHSLAFDMRKPIKGANNSGSRPAQKCLPMRPCLRCVDIFPNMKFLPQPFAGQRAPYWKHGNCAECEAVSKLLCGERSVNDRVLLPRQVISRALGLRNTPVSLDTALSRLLRHREERLREILIQRGFQLGEQLEFYSP